AATTSVSSRPAAPPISFCSRATRAPTSGSCGASSPRSSADAWSTSASAPRRGRRHDRRRRAHRRPGQRRGRGRRGGRRAHRDLPGTVQVIGTPAEEGGGGKIRLLEAGVFEGVDVALSSHPGSHLTLIDPDPKLPWGLALIGYRYAYHGKAAHAAMAPQEGINALNAVLRLFSGIDTLRQHVRDDVRIHGVITDGGKAPNVV